MSDDKTQHIQRWLDRMVEADAMLNLLHNQIGVQPGGPLYYLIANLMSALTAQVEIVVGDEFGTLHWHWLDNDLGRKGREYAINNERRSIVSAEDLVWVLEPRK